jgi:hypothetical protein
MGMEATALAAVYMLNDFVGFEGAGSIDDSMKASIKNNLIRLLIGSRVLTLQLT